MNKVYEFPIATDNTLKIVGAISYVFDNIYRQGVRFYHCGVGGVELENSLFQQQDIFTLSVNNPPLMKCYDQINHRYGRGSVEVSMCGRFSVDKGVNNNR